MELIDILDEFGNKIGKTSTIKELHTSGKWHKIVGIIIYDFNNNILVQQRALKQISSPGKWDIAAAGHVNSGETEIDAIKRELFEEIGLDLEEDKVKFFMSYKKEVNNKTVNKKHLEDIYIAQIDSNCIESFNIQKDEVQQVKWISINELKEMIKNNQLLSRSNLYERLFEFLRGDENET